MSLYHYYYYYVCILKKSTFVVPGRWGMNGDVTHPYFTQSFSSPSNKTQAVFIVSVPLNDQQPVTLTTSLTLIIISRTHTIKMQIQHKKNYSRKKLGT